MSRTLVATAVLMLALSPARAASLSVEEMRDEVIKMVADDDWSAHTCQRVVGLGKGTVSPGECASKVAVANAECTELAKAKVPGVTSEQEAKFLVEILMTCPVAKVLGVGYVIDGKSIHIQWNEIGR